MTQKKAHSALSITPIQHSTLHIQHYKTHQPTGPFHTQHEPHSTLNTQHYNPHSACERIRAYLLRRRRNLCVNPSFRMASANLRDLRENIKHPACSLAPLAHKSLPQISQIFTDLSLCTCHVPHSTSQAPPARRDIPHSPFNHSPSKGPIPHSTL